MICEKLDTLAFRRDVSLPSLLYYISHGKCSGELFFLLPAAEFPYHTVCGIPKYHSTPHHLSIFEKRIYFKMLATHL